jgi:hypothetical protein
MRRVAHAAVFTVDAWKRRPGLISTSEVLAEVARLLGAVDHSGRGLATDAERLELLQTAVRVAGQGTALAQQLAGEVVASEAAEHAPDLPIRIDRWSVRPEERRPVTKPAECSVYR